MNFCANCGVEVVRKPSFWKKLKGLACCSKTCRAEYLKTAYFGEANPNYAGGDILDRWFHTKATNLKGRAKYVKIDCTVTGSELKSIYVAQNGLCFYSGIPLKLASTENFRDKNQADLDVLSVDRIDPEKGYHSDNIVLCCNAINKMKGNAKLDYFSDFLNLVTIKSTAPCRLNIKRLRENAKLPMKIGLGDAGWDLSVSSVESKGDYLKVGTGIAVSSEPGWFFEVYARSSLHKKNLMLANGVGIIDNGYRGEIFLMLLKLKPDATVEIGERVGQLVPKRYTMVELKEVEELHDTSRGSGGFGSTGK